MLLFSWANLTDIVGLIFIMNEEGSKYSRWAFIHSGTDFLMMKLENTDGTKIEFNTVATFLKNL